MRISVATLEFCRKKYGKGALCGFEDADDGATESKSENDIELLYDELKGNEMLAFSEDTVHLSTLGQHILNMMLNPDLFILVDNRVLKTVIRIYIRNAYYLCVLENADLANDSKIIIELLPSLKEVVSSFAYALYCDDDIEPETDGAHPQQEDCDIHVIAKARDTGNGPVSELSVWGNYCKDDVCYRIRAMSNSSEADIRENRCGVSEFINLLTEWMFGELSQIMTREEQ